MNENELVKLIVDTLHSDVTWIDGIDKDIIAEVIRLTSSLEDIKSPSNKTPLRDVLSPSQKQQLNNFFNSIQKQALASQIRQRIEKGATYTQLTAVVKQQLSIPHYNKFEKNWTQCYEKTRI